MTVDFNVLDRTEKGLLLFGALSVALTLFNRFETSTYRGKGINAVTVGQNAWNGVGVLGSLFLLAAFLITVGRIFANESLPVGPPWALIAVSGAVAGSLILIVKGLTFDGGAPMVTNAVAHMDAGPGWSGWLLFVASISFAVLTWLGFKESDGRPTRS